MIFKRAVAKLRAQDGVAISVELSIVILGVFIGTWVADWNQRQSERREATALIVRLRPLLTALEKAEASERVVWKAMRPSTFCAIWWIWPLSTVTDPNRASSFSACAESSVPQPQSA